jgi:hypothetical protein
MKKLLIHLSIFTAIFSGLLLIFLLQFNGRHDDFYLRFTTPPQNNLIIGTSRAAQALIPSEINPFILPKKIYNYAFSIYHSPFGEVYHNSIRKKLNEKTQNGVFIVCIDPWSLGVTIDSLNKNEVNQENDYALSGVRFVNYKPNLEYLFLYSNNSLIDKYLNKNKSTFLHSDGWLEVDIPMDSPSIQKRLNEKIEQYTQKQKEYIRSKNRWEWMVKTVELLQQHGEVYFVRLPVHSEILALENKVWPGFSESVSAFSKKHQLPFLDFSSQSERYSYTDGNHLHQSSSKVISREIGKWIQEQAGRN